MQRHDRLLTGGEQRGHPLGASVTSCLVMMATLDNAHMSESLRVYEKALKHQYRRAKQTQIVVGDFDGERINSLPRALASSQHYLLS